MKRAMIDVDLLLEPAPGLTRAVAQTVALQLGMRWTDIAPAAREHMERAAAAALRKAAGYLTGGPVVAPGEARP